MKNLNLKLQNLSNVLKIDASIYNNTTAHTETYCNGKEKCDHSTGNGY